MNVHANLHAICFRQYVKNKAIPELVELVRNYNPEILWSDSGDAVGQGEYIGSQDFIAWLYNESPVKEKVVINDRYVYTEKFLDMILQRKIKS